MKSESTRSKEKVLVETLSEYCENNVHTSMSKLSNTIQGRSSSTRTRGSSSWRRLFRSSEARASLRMETMSMEKLWKMAIITEMESTMEMGKLQQTDTTKMTTKLVLCSFSPETENVRKLFSLFCTQYLCCYYFKYIFIHTWSKCSKLTYCNFKTAFFNLRESDFLLERITSL